MAGRGGSWIAVLATVAATVVAAGAPATAPGSTASAGVQVPIPLLPEPVLRVPSPDAARRPLVIAGPSTRAPRATPSPVPTVPCTPASVEERAGRVLVVGLPNVTSPTDELVGEVLDVGVGGVMLTHVNVQNRDQVSALVTALRVGSKGPLLVAADEEPGRVRAFEDVIGPVPSARRLAAEQTETAVQDVARANGSALATVGVNVALAPVADLDAGPWDGIIGDRSFSGDPLASSRYALAYARGLRDAGVIPVVKHFPGHGRAADDDHVELPEVGASLGELMGSDLLPFAEAIGAGAPVVMMSNVAYDALEPGVPASLSPAAYDLLRGLGFKGAAMTDSVGMGAVNLRWDFDEAVVKAVAAGADVVLATDGSQARRMRDALVAAVRSGRLDEGRLDEAAARSMALAGGDPTRLTCRSVDLPVLR